MTVEISSEKHVTLSKVLVHTKLLSKNVIKNLSKIHKHPVIPDLLNKLNTQIKTRLFDLESNILYADSTILNPRFKQKGFRALTSYEKAIADLRRRVRRIRKNSAVIENQEYVNASSDNED